MNKFLVVGVDTVAGANLAASFAEQHQVSTWASASGYEIANCDALSPELTPSALISQSSADCVLYCGPAARSAWEPGTKALVNDAMVADAEMWAATASAANVKFVMISSDAVFSGPWMFHDENSLGLCPSYQSEAIRTAESQILENCAGALIVRTNTFGWSAGPEGSGWVESLLKNVETKRLVQQDHIRHSTPILATDMAEIVRRACMENLEGIFHVAGAERVSPLSFTQRLADEFELPWLALRRESFLSEAPQDFAEGECSLQTKQIRKALCVAMPLLSEGLKRLHAQAENGYREKLRCPPVAAPARKVA
ncbi:sugar nucleotide-binding protein [Planctomicrobium sp. SH668]|uniref:sugar nucleotide-binding protein n=1 Tax=Planctomicrobium sp. SH668 TaxID=3448126 RepID=UPI003F5C09E5